MKKFALLLLPCALIVCFLTFAACNNGVNGVYYRYWSDGRVEQRDYFKLKNGKWSEGSGRGGVYELDGENITLYADRLQWAPQIAQGTIGEDCVMARGTVKNGVLTLTSEVQGNVYVYCKDGVTPSEAGAN